MEKIVLVGSYMAIVFVFLYIVKKIADGITRFDDDAAIEKEGNVAVALRRFGLYLGFCTAMAGVMNGGLSKLELTFFLMDGVIATAIFFAANYLNDYVIIRGVRNNDLICAGNIPTGMVEAGSFIATGVLLNGAFSGDVGNFLTAIAQSIWAAPEKFGGWTIGRTRRFQTLIHPDHLGRAFRVLVQSRPA